MYIVRAYTRVHARPLQGYLAKIFPPHFLYFERSGALLKLFTWCSVSLRTHWNSYYLRKNFHVNSQDILNDSFSNIYNKNTIMIKYYD